MADNTTLNNGTGGDTVRSIDRSGDSTPILAKTQVMQLDAGGEAGESLVSPANPLPVSPDNAAPDGSAYNLNNVPEVGIAGGKGTDGNVHGLLTDSAGKLQTVDTNAAAATSSDAPLFLAISGDPNGDFAGVNIIEQVVTDGSGLSFNVKIVNPRKADVQGAAVLSDAPAPMWITAPVGATVVVDTTGYQSVNIGSQTLAGNITGTNDFKTFSAISGSPVALGTLATAVTAGANFWFPCPTRYLVITPTTAGTAVLYLRNTPWNGTYTTTVPTGVAQDNVAQYGGTAVVTGGVAGVPAAGGNVAPGAARTANPVPMGGADAGNLTRTLLTDTAGRAQAAMVGVDFTGTQRQVSVQPTSNPAVAATLVQDMTSLEGQTHVELLGQILIEMKILNQQIFLLNSQGGCSASDEPAAMRADQASLFSPN